MKHLEENLRSDRKVPKNRMLGNVHRSEES